ncbi:hypothetical protein SVIO_001400 [Streptomyces violaceusniger]|uniref:NADP-dependent oxidoreductase domain-containing protein n=1 Tax=Streptomyces violaceusniger TaxID=68280 RepID=A0A4D4KSS7_STRVO|nr:hypothetical protein SVIO_001400 [Streptomyces violaceusniger]
MLAGKVGATSDPGGQYGLRPAQRPAELRSELAANLRTLGVERLDVVNIYPMYGTHGISTTSSPS